ncbi:hypothetical protein SAZ10_11850 [Mesorhizobium sp. BAC0120]|uniref:hypothetical protein n=1 Tax=Mesorhizobium sp. BAC0120 TaxID=3090670 RepID=UPI00298BDC4A|nr:hypothetical protein [Mesorhizobium sp. BAC0120]MDW6022448.1 hypothetical protein [Mesorhizobium sp. BAC0120]
MLTTFKTAAIAGLIGLSALAAVPAKADSIYLGFGDNHRDPRFGVYVGGDGERYYRRDHRRDDYRYDDRRAERCSPDHALFKAERMGIRRARIDFVSPRRIGVVGRSRGDWVNVTFARAPGCPVIG